MEINRICILGGSGFVGSHLAHQLSTQCYQVCIPTRLRDRAKSLILLPTVDVVQAEIHDDTALTRLLEGMDVVVNLVGVLHDARGSRGFQAAHVELTRKVLAACQHAAVKRYLHMSALGADPNGPSKYLRSKGEAEVLVRSSQLDWTMFRPSVVFGPGDSFLTLFACLLRALPVVVLGSPRARFQPVFVEDVVNVMVRSISDRTSVGASYDLAGPKVYTLRELVRLVGQVTGRPRPIIGLNDTLSYMQALAMEWLPIKLLTRDNYHSMKVDNVSSQPFPFGITPASLESQAPVYLGKVAPRDRYDVFRDRAGRLNGQP